MRSADLPLALRLALRSHAGGNRALTILAVSSITTAVALATGLDIGAESVRSEIERTGDELAGAAELEIVAGDVGVPDALLERVAAVPGVAVAAPFVEATVRARLEAREIALHVIGVDLLADTQVRDYDFEDGAAKIGDPLRLLATPGAVAIASSLARELGLREGDSFSVRHGRDELTLTVRGVLAAGGIAEAFGGRIAVADVYLLQTLLGREGWLDRIEIVAAPDADLAAVAAGLESAIAGAAVVRKSATRSGWVETTLLTVQRIVSVMVIAAVLVASLLSYAAMSLFVARRSRELALLRVIGLEARRVERFLYADALVLAAVGSALGLAAGLLLSRSFVALLSNLTDFLDAVEADRLVLAPRTVLLAAGVGVAVAMAGMIPAARAAARRAPLAELAMHRAGSTPRAGLGVRAAALAIAALWAAVCAVPLGLAPLVRVGAILALGLVSLVLGVRLLLPPLLDAARPAFERVLPGIGRLAGASLVARPLHSALHVAAVAGVVAGITVTGILQRSLARTIDTWTSSQFPDAILVTPAVGMSFESQQHLAPDVVAAVRETPGVRAVFEQYATKLLHGGEEVLLSAGDMRVMADAGRLPAIDADPRALALGIAAGEIGVSDQFARRFDVSKGDVLTIATPNGPCDLRVAGILRDYAGPGGSLNLDLAVFDSLWPRPGARNVVVWSSGAPEEIVRSIETQVGGRQPLFFAFGSELEQYATRLLARFTSALDLVAALTTLLGGVAVMNLLLGAVAERRRELRLMRSTGATRGQIATLVVADGAIAGTLGGLAGLGLGVACAVPLTGDLVAASLGWSLEVSIGAASLAKLLGGVVLASLVASAYPAWIARRVMARDVLAGE